MQAAEKVLCLSEAKGMDIKMNVTELIDKTMLKFLMVGVVNTLVGTGVMLLAYNVLNLNYWISSASNYVIGSMISYVLNKYFTFRNRDRSIKQLLLFVLHITLCYLFAYGAAKPLVYHVLESASVTVRDNCAMLAGMVLFIVLNYLGQRFLVFKTKESI